MNDTWKIAQGLVQENQNNSFGINDKQSIPPKMQWFDELAESSQLRDMMWRYLSTSSILRCWKDKQHSTAKQIKSFLKEYKREKGGLPDSIRIGEMVININHVNPNMITFNVKKNREWNVEYPYTITINGDDIYSEVDVIDNDYGHGSGYNASYEENDSYIPISVSRKVSVINGEEINESFYINPIQEQTNFRTILERIAQNNPKYKIGNGNEIYRENIDPEEELKDFLGKPISQQETSLETIYELRRDEDQNMRRWRKYGGKEFSYYEQCMYAAKKIEEHCKGIYSSFMEAYKELEKESKGAEDEGKKSSTERTSKLGRVKELIAVSNVQDMAISKLENEKQEKGVEVGE